MKKKGTNYDTWTHRELVAECLMLRDGLHRLGMEAGHIQNTYDNLRKAIILFVFFNFELCNKKLPSEIRELIEKARPVDIARAMKSS